MPRPLICLLVLSSFVSTLAACSAEQVYSGGQAWQRTECNRLPDGLERTRCLERADTSYETYRKEKAAAESGR